MIIDSTGEDEQPSSPSDADKALLADLRSSDLRRRDRAYADLYNTAGKKLKSHFRKLGAIDADADDWVNEAFRVFHEKLDTFRGDSSLKTWLYTIAKHVRFDSLRKGNRRKTEPYDEGGGDPPNPKTGPIILPNPNPGPEATVISDKYVECVTRALKEFVKKKPDQTQLLLWKGLDELEYEDIAKILETSVPAVRQQMYMVRKAIEELTRHCNDGA